MTSYSHAAMAARSSRSGYFGSTGQSQIEKATSMTSRKGNGSSGVSPAARPRLRWMLAITLLSLIPRPGAEARPIGTSSVPQGGAHTLARASGVGLRISSKSLNGSLRWGLPERTVVATWTHPSLLGVKRSSQKFAVRYSPTAACFLEDGSIAVAGMTSSSKLVIEVWTMQYPTPDMGMVSQSGTVHVPEYRADVTAVGVAFESGAGNAEHVSDLLPLMHSGGCILARLGPTKRVCKIEPSSGELVTIVAPTSELGGGAVPELAQDFNYVTIGHHASKGRFYLFSMFHDSGGTSMTSSTPVSGFDANLDGVIDTWEARPFTEVALDLYNPTLHLQPMGVIEL